MLLFYRKLMQFAPPLGEIFQPTPSFVLFLAKCQCPSSVQHKQFTTKLNTISNYGSRVSLTLLLDLLCKKLL